MAEVSGGSPTSTPERVHKERVLRSADLIAFAILSLIGIATIVNFGATWVSIGWGSHPVAYGVLTALLMLVILNHQGRWFFLIPMRRPRPMAPSPGARVAVVTTYVPVTESAAMLEQSLRAIVAIEYPHDSWLLDEGNDADVRDLCDRLGVRHFSRRGRPEYQTEGGVFRSATKHGNYNAWLHDVGFDAYDFLVAFDPDHLPIPSFASRTLGYFRDPAVGYVQAAQAFYNQSVSLIARGAAEETYGYFSAVQMAAYGMSYPIIVGSHNAHRMAALREVGGFAAHDADDLLLTQNYRAAGWDGVYVPEILARGLTPVDWDGYLVQQRRWARSVLDVKVQHGGSRAAALPLRSRIMSRLHGINFLHRSLVYLGALLVLFFLLYTGESLDVVGSAMLVPALALFVALEAQDLYRQRFFLDWRSEWGTHWRVAMLGLAKWPTFLLAQLDVLLGRRPHYAVTRKASSSGRHWRFVAWNVGLAVAIVLAWALGRAPSQVQPAVVLAATAVVIGSLTLAVSGLLPSPPPYQSGLWNPIDAPGNSAGDATVSVGPPVKAT